MHNRSLLILAVLVLGFGAFIWFFERHQPTTDEVQRQSEKLFGDLEKNEIQTFELTNAGETFVFERTSSGWLMLQPIRTDADSPAVDRLVNALINLKADRRMGSDEVDPASYQLDNPAYVIKLVEQNGDTHTLGIGSETALGSKRAVMLDGPEIILTTGGFAASLDKKLDDWRSRSLAEVFLNDLASIEILSGADRIKAVNLNEGWRLLAPVEDLADEELLRNITTDLHSIRIEEFLDGAITDEGLDLSPARIEVTLLPTDGSESTTLEFGSVREIEGTEQVACRRNGKNIFWVTNRAEIGLAKAPVRWREPKVLPFETWNVHVLEIAAADKDVLLSRSDGLWRQNDGNEVDSSAVQERLSGLAQMKATNFDLMDLARPEIGRVILHLNQPGRTGENQLVFVFSEPLGEGGDVLVKVTGRDIVMTAAPEDVASVLAHLEELQSVEAEPAPEE